MRIDPRRSVTVLLLVLALFGVVPVVATAQTQEDVDHAEAQKEQAFQDLIDANNAVGHALADLEAINEELIELEYVINRLEGRIDEYEQQVVALDESARDLVVEAYITGGSDLVMAAFSADTIQDLLTSQVLIDSATDRDLAALDLLAAVNRENDRLKVELDARKADVESLQTRQAAKVEELDAAREHAEDVLAYAEANFADVVQRYKEELRRQAEEEARRQREEEARRQAEAAAAASASSSSSSGSSSGSSDSGSSDSGSGGGDSGGSSDSGSSDSGSSGSDSSSSSSDSGSSDSGSSGSSDSGSSGSSDAPGAGGLPPSTTSGVVCPVAGSTWFVDTWGAPRPGGRTHKGTDMAAASGTPLVAMDAGRLRLNWHYAGGRQVYIYTDSGAFYYYAHLSGYANVSSGQRRGNSSATWGAPGTRRRRTSTSGWARARACTSTRTPPSPPSADARESVAPRQPQESTRTQKNAHPEERVPRVPVRGFHAYQPTVRSSRRSGEAIEQLIHGRGERKGAGVIDVDPADLGGVVAGSELTSDRRGEEVDHRVVIVRRHRLVDDVADPHGFADGDLETGLLASLAGDGLAHALPVALTPTRHGPMIGVGARSPANEQDAAVLDDHRTNRRCRSELIVHAGDTTPERSRFRRTGHR
jgi:murein DD-endopeptidase MepM/ murein hydrolase activator NlpD